MVPFSPSKPSQHWNRLVASLQDRLSCTAAGHACLTKCLENQQAKRPVTSTGQSQPIQLAEIAERVRAYLDPLLRCRGLQIAVEPFGSCSVALDQVHVDNVVFCLMLDAATHAPSGTTIEFHVGCYGADLEIEVCHAGPRNANILSPIHSLLMAAMHETLPGSRLQELKCPQGGRALHVSIPMGSKQRAA